MKIDIFSKFSSWWFQRQSLPYWCIFVIDCIIIYATSIFVCYFFHGGRAIADFFWQLTGTICVYMLFNIIGFRIFHTYAGILRYSSFVDLQRVGMSMLVGFVMIMIARRFFHLDYYLLPIRMRELILIALVGTLLMWGVRILAKYLFDISSADANTRGAFIYGVNDSGVGLARSIRSENPIRFKLEGFVSEDKKNFNLQLMGVKVYPIDDKLIYKMQEKSASVFLIAPAMNEAMRNNEKLQNALISASIRIYMMPHAKEFGKDDGDATQLKKVDVEDLLPRNEITVDMASVGALLENKRIMVTGSAGSIGSEMVRQIAIYRPAQLILIDQAETPQHDIRLMMAREWPDIKTETIVASISNSRHMEKIFASFRPDYVFHAAAYKHVPMMENDPSESVGNNIYGTKVIADLSVKYGAKKFVMISTDKAVNPTNVMGCSKRICEIYVQSLDKAIKDGKIEGVTQFVTTRFGNVLGSNGSVIPLFRKQIDNGGPVTVTDPRINRFFMLIPEACKLVLEAGTKGKGGEIFVFDMGKPVKIDDLAKRMIKLSGAKNVQVVYTGLRNGEKLYEEVLNEKERCKTTFHPKIKIASVREYDYNNISENINKLINTSQTCDDMEIVRQMKEIVPEYISNNSKYEVLDKTTHKQLYSNIKKDRYKFTNDKPVI